MYAVILLQVYSMNYHITKLFILFLSLFTTVIVYIYIIYMPKFHPERSDSFIYVFDKSILHTYTKAV